MGWYFKSSDYYLIAPKRWLSAKVSSEYTLKERSSKRT